MVPANTVYHNTKVASRDAMINRMKDEVFDVLVIGGGATGAGVALDASTRGLKTALVEGDDFASGTSSRSTKLIHGGVRYLESAFKDFDLEPLKLVIEALEERAHLMKIAPHMSEPMPIVMPVFSNIELPYFWVGIKLYDWIAKFVCAFDTGLPDSHYSSTANAHFLFPYLDKKANKLAGSLIYYDGMHNDARMNLALIRTAAAEGWVDNKTAAAVGNHLSVVRLLHNEKKELIGAIIKDSVRNEEFKVRAKTVINCTGPFADNIRKMADSDAEPLITPAAGVHIVLPKWYANNGIGMIIPETSDGRVLFALPWENNVIVGTTDGKSELSHEPRATEQEVAFIVREAARYWSVSEEEINQDIQAAWTGLRPLCKDVKHHNNSLRAQPSEVDKANGGVASSLKDEKKDGTMKISRTHQIVVDPSGLISVLGGKWTTYRKMAQDAVDVLIHTHKDKLTNLHGEAKTDFTACKTKNLRLVGAVSFEEGVSSVDLDRIGGAAPRLLSQRYPQLTNEQASHLIKNYGADAFDLCRESTAADLTPLVPGQAYLKAEVHWAIQNEMACTVGDVLARRMRLAFVDSKSAERVAPEVAKVLGKHFVWDAKRIEQETDKGVKFIQTLYIQKAKTKAVSDASALAVSAAR